MKNYKVIVILVVTLVSNARSDDEPSRVKRMIFSSWWNSDESTEKPSTVSPLQVQPARFYPSPYRGDQNQALPSSIKPSLPAGYQQLPPGYQQLPLGLNAFGGPIDYRGVPQRQGMPVAQRVQIGENVGAYSQEMPTVINSAEAYQSLGHSSAANELLMVAKQLGIKNLKSLPRMEEVMELLGTKTHKETIEAIKEFASTPGGVEMINSFLDSSTEASSVSETKVLPPSGFSSQLPQSAFSSQLPSFSAGSYPYFGSPYSSYVFGDSYPRVVRKEVVTESKNNDGILTGRLGSWLNLLNPFSRFGFRRNTEVKTPEKITIPASSYPYFSSYPSYDFPSAPFYPSASPYAYKPTLSAQTSKTVLPNHITSSNFASPPEPTLQIKHTLPPTHVWIDPPQPIAVPQRIVPAKSTVGVPMLSYSHSGLDAHFGASEQSQVQQMPAPQEKDTPEPQRATSYDSTAAGTVHHADVEALQQAVNAQPPTAVVAARPTEDDRVDAVASLTSKTFESNVDAANIEADQ